MCMKRLANQIMWIRSNDVLGNGIVLLNDLAICSEAVILNGDG